MKTKKYLSLDLVSLETDPIQYKPYAPSFVLTHPTRVNVPIDVTELDTMSDGSFELSMNGFKCLLRELADAISDVHRERNTK